MANYKLFFDGSCGPKNPGGTGAYGYALYSEGVQEPTETGSGVIGEGPGMSNNVAEFHALLQGLMAFDRKTGQTNNHTQNNLSVVGDSKLVVEVMSKRWKPKIDKLYFQTYIETDEFLRRLRRHGALVTFDHVGRTHNQVCDDLSKAHQKKA